MRTCLFALPLAVAFAGFDWLLWRSGEAWTCARAAEETERDPRTLYMRGVVSQQFYLYKSEMIRRRKPTLLVLGSSRVWQFRREMFPSAGEAFYNAGGMIQNLADLEAYAASVGEGRMPAPGAIVLGVDGWWLKREPSEQGVSRSWKRSRDRDEVADPRAHINGVREMMRRGLTPWRLVVSERPVRVDGRRPLGLAAFAGGGFRSDGSVTAHIAEAEFAATGRYRDRETPPIIDRIRNRTHQFLATEGLDESRVERLLAALRILKSRGIAVSVLLPPVSDECLSALQSSAELSAWWTECLTRLPKRLAEEGFGCHVAESPRQLGLDDRYMIDGFHPSETFVTLIVEAMISAGKASWEGRGKDAARMRELRAGARATPISLGLP